MGSSAGSWPRKKSLSGFPEPKSSCDSFAEPPMARPLGRFSYIVRVPTPGIGGCLRLCEAGCPGDRGTKCLELVGGSRTVKSLIERGGRAPLTVSEGLGKERTPWKDLRMESLGFNLKTWLTLSKETYF